MERPDGIGRIGQNDKIHSAEHRGLLLRSIHNVGLRLCEIDFIVWTVIDIV